MNFLLALSPVILIFILVVFFKIDILKLSIISTIYVVVIAFTYFNTLLYIIFLSTIDGILTTLPIILVVYTGILLSQFLIEKKSLQRLTSSFSINLKDKMQKSLVLACGFGNFFEGAGVIAEPVVAPMAYSTGISPQGSVVLSILGYSGLMHLALAGVIVTVLAAVTSISPYTLAVDLAILSFPATFFLAVFIPYLIGEPKLLKKYLILIIAVSIIINISAYFTVKYISYSVSAMIGGLGGLIFLFLSFRVKIKIDKNLLRDATPFILIFIFLAGINLIHPVKEKVFNELIFKISVIPIHTIKIRPLFSAYIYLFTCFLVSYKLFAEKEDKISKYLKNSIIKAYKPVISMALFGAMGSIIAFSGLQQDLHTLLKTQNMAYNLATGFINYSGKFYPLFAPVLGWIGTFLTGYGIASIMLFGKLQLSAAKILGISQSYLSSSLTVGASIGSISSPFKIAIASPLCNCVGKENEVLKKTIPIGIFVSLLIGVFTLLTV